MNIDIIDNWANANPLSIELKRKSQIDGIEDNSDRYINNVINPLFKLMPCCNITSNEYDVTFDKCATNIIKDILRDYTKDNCIILLSPNEHENVTNACKDNQCNYHIIRDEYSNKAIVDLINDYDTIIVYWIGTQLSTGIINQTIIFDRIKKLAKNKTVIAILDDVQGMYIVPRDYSKFDYIIGTAHSILCEFDLGILIRNRRMKQYGFHWINSGKLYVSLLEKVFKQHNIMFANFYSMMSNAFEYEIYLKQAETFKGSAPNIFSIYIPRLELSDNNFNIFNKYYIHLEKNNKGYVYMRFRAQEFIYDYGVVRPGLLKIKQLLLSSE